MAEEQDNLEQSLPVPSVQEISMQQLDTVPSRFIRDEIVTFHSHESLHVPLIDMKKLANPEFHDVELQKLHSACKEWGMFQIINHGISIELLADIKKQAQEFFDLPILEKKHWAQETGCLEGYGQAFVTSVEQKLDWNDMIFLKVLPLNKRKLQFWPNNPTKFRETLEIYSEEIRQVTVSLSRFIARALGLDLDETQELCKAYDEGTYDVRFNCYPPCPQPDRVIGMIPHADMSGITLLLDCGNVPGLQVLKDGKWVLVQPFDGAIVVNTGQITEIISNGMYKAPDHRAVVNRSKERLSIVAFCYPNSSLKIGPAKQAVFLSGSPPLYKTHYRPVFSQILQSQARSFIH